MNRPHRSIEIFTMSALDLFITAMGSFAILMMILFPYYHGEVLDTVTHTPGNVLFCVWPVRVQDFEAFVQDVPDPAERGETPNDPKRILHDDAWKDPGYEQGPDFPVTLVTLAQAEAFCRWLTRKERAAGTIGPEDEYRLPTDEEWSAAAGPGKYVWGRKWPPPPKAGNFADETWAHGLGYKSGIEEMQGYTDQHEMVAPVGSYDRNRFGLFDMAGNVRQWVSDPFRASMVAPDLLQESPGLKEESSPEGKPYSVLRGSTWRDSGSSLRSDVRTPMLGTVNFEACGFRCVLVVKSASAAAKAN